MNEPQGTTMLDGLRMRAENGSVDDALRLAIALIDAQRMDQALPWLQRAAEAGHPGAMIELGRIRLYGMAGAPAPEAAAHWFERAERAGHPAASDYLVQIALGGTILPRDQRINDRLMAAAQAGYAPALLAVAIHFGRKAHAEDQALCLQLLERAAAHGEAVAAALLAERLAHGEGCEAQPDAAEDLRAQLAANGFARLPDFSVAPPQVMSDAPPRRLGLEEVLQAPPARTLLAQPSVRVIDPLLSADECRLLIASAQPHLHDSQTADPVTGVPLTLPVRTSSETCFDPVLETSALRLVQLRMASAAGIDLPNAEQLTVLRYAPGQQYRPHRDYLPQGTLQMDRPHAGNRCRTVCVYLNAVAAGGHTEFPQLGVRVEPMPGRALIFDNMRADGSLEPDSLHAGTPVEAGVKWLSTLWIRQMRYRFW